MNEKCIQAYKHIQVVRGTFYGIITHDDLQSICDRYELTLDESAQLVAQLKEEGVSIISNDEKNVIIKQIEAKKLKSKNETMDDDSTTSQDNSKPVFVVTDDAILEIANTILLELKWSEQEITAIKTLIRNEVCHVCERMRRHAGPHIIAESLIKIGIDRGRRKLEEKGKRGWVCGTYTSRVRDYMSRQLRVKYSEERLTALVGYCNEGVTGDAVMEALLVCLIKEIRPIIVHAAFDLSDL